MATIEHSLTYENSAKKCCRPRTPEFEKDESIHLDGVLSREEHLWAMNEFDEVVKKHHPRMRRALFVYIFLSIIPWILFAAMINGVTEFNMPWMIAFPIVLQLLNVAGFLWWVRVKGKAFRKGLSEKAAAINEHFSGRGVNFVVKKNAERGHLGDRVIIEVAARNAAPAHAPAYAQQPALYPAPAPPQYAVVQQLPPNAVPMAAYPTDYASPYGAPSVVDHEQAGLLQKM